MRKLFFLLVCLIVEIDEVCAVTLPTTQYSYFGTEPETEDIEGEWGSLITGSYLALYENICDYKGEPTKCNVCCQGKYDSCVEHCDGDPDCIVNCAISNSTCVNDCLEGGRPLPLDSDLCVMFMIAASLCVSTLRFKCKTL